MFKILVERYQRQNCMAGLINEVTVLNELRSYLSLYYARQIENLSERQLQIIFFIIIFFFLAKRALMATERQKPFPSEP